MFPNVRNDLVFCGHCINMIFKWTCLNIFDTKSVLCSFVSSLLFIHLVVVWQLFSVKCMKGEATLVSFRHLNR
jgi:hypothetical protein